MPWTLAHPAAVLPVTGGLVPGALVAGAMAPDLWFHLPPALAPWLPTSWWTHGPLSPVTVSLAVGLALFVCWRWWWRAPVLAALPEPWATAAAAQSAVLAPGLRRRTAPRLLAVVVLSVVVGAATHVAIDVLTHEPGGVNPGWVWLEERIGPLRMFLWLQYLLSVAGLALLAWWCVRWVAGVADWHGFRVTPALALLVAAVAGGALIGALMRSGGDPVAGIDESVTGGLSTLLLGGVAGGTVALVLWAGAARWYESRRRRRVGGARAPVRRRDDAYARDRAA